MRRRRSRGRAATRSSTRCRGPPAAPACAGPPTIASSSSRIRTAGRTLLFASSIRASGGKPTLLTPGAFMVEHVVAHAGPTDDSSSTARTPDRDRHDIDRRHVFKVRGRRLRAADAADERAPGSSGAPVATGDGRTVAFLASDAQQLAAAGGRCRSPAASGERSRRDRVPARLPVSAARHAGAGHVHARATASRSTGSCSRPPAADARRPALVYVHGGPPRQMLLGWHYMDYYANDYAREPVPRQPRLHRARGELPPGHRLRSRVSVSPSAPARAARPSTSTWSPPASYLQARPDVDATRIGIWGGSYGGYLTALALGRNSDIFAAGVDIHGVHNWDAAGTRRRRSAIRAIVGDGITEADMKASAARACTNHRRSRR